MTVELEERPQDSTRVDPRIAARRRSVEQERRGRRRRRLLVVAVALTVVAAGWFATRTALLDVDDVEVIGAERTSPEAVLEASGVEAGEPLVGLDTGAAAGRVEALPWVASAAVERAIDGHVTITVTEREPVATLTNTSGDGTTLLVDASGRVLGPTDAPPEGMVVLTGLEAVEPGATVEGAADALSAWAALGPGARSRVLMVGRSPEGELTLGLKPQGLVVLGPPTDLELKAEKLTTLLGQMDQSDLDTISMLDPSDPVVRRNPG